MRIQHDTLTSLILGATATAHHSQSGLEYRLTWIKALMRADRGAVSSLCQRIFTVNTAASYWHGSVGDTAPPPSSSQGKTRARDPGKCRPANFYPRVSAHSHGRWKGQFRQFIKFPSSSESISFSASRTQLLQKCPEWCEEHTAWSSVLTRGRLGWGS